MDRPRDQSEFNYAIEWLKRLDEGFSVAFYAAMGLDAFTWYHSLIGIRRMLSDDMKKEEREKANEFKLKINNVLPQAMRQNMFNGSNQIPGELYELLDGFEIYLRDIVKKSGYKTKVKEDPRFALTGGGG